jgi:hypothetical protein
MAKTGLLTSNQRDSLEGEPEKTGEEREMRKRIRKRIYNALALDGHILFEELRDTDREQIFRSSELSHLEAAAFSEEDRKDKLKKSIGLEPGITGLLAFIYTGLEERAKIGDGSFKPILKTAMGRVADQNGWELEEFQFKVKFNKDPDFDSWHEDFEAGDATLKEATKLLEQEKITQDEFTEYVNEHLV